jgi:GntR family transcriptional regulator
MIQHGVAMPPWRQLAEILRREIRSGRRKAGSRLPSILTMSQDYGLAAVTVRKAVDQLKREGLVISQPGWGIFVADPLPPPPL